MTRNATSPRPVSENQSVGTPWEFIWAVERYRGPLYCDLAATADNRKADLWIGPSSAIDSEGWLGMSFFREDPPEPPPGHYNWLNPPFADIEPWVQRVVEQELPTLILVPASVGSAWYGEWVEGYMAVSFLRPRIKFEGHTTPASDYNNEDGSGASIYVHDGKLEIEVTGKFDWLEPSPTIVITLDDVEKAAHWLVGALRVVHSHLGVGR